MFNNEREAEWHVLATPGCSRMWRDSPFFVALERGPDGEFLPTLTGLRFLGELYERQ